MKNAVFVAATRQHVGKTSTCLGLLHGLKKRCQKIGFIKPVGQHSVLTENGIRVDKDVRVAKECFNLDTCEYKDMSPVVIPSGYTRDFLDGKISIESQLERIHKSFQIITSQNEFTVVEGTGHTGVGSIVNVNNARVAYEMGIDMILIANGGLGNAFDELALNHLMCKTHGVKIRGIILNKVKHDKMEMIKEYFPKAIKQWDTKLLGIVPDLETLAYPSASDFEELFKVKVLCGADRKHRVLRNKSLVTAGLRKFLTILSEKEEFHDTMFITHASRNDIILAFISHVNNYETKTGKEFGGALLLTGEPPNDKPQEYILEIIALSKCPILYVPLSTFKTMEKINGFTAKYNDNHMGRVSDCAKHYSKYIDFDSILNH